MMREFCEDAAAFLGGGEGRTIAVHCKAGRGRTGLMVCAYLLHSVRHSVAVAVARVAALPTVFKLALHATASSVWQLHKVSRWGRCCTDASPI